MHRHKCGSCGAVWEHDANQIMDSIKAHSCPVCGEKEYRIYHGSGRAKYLNDGGSITRYDTRAA